MKAFSLYGAAAFGGYLFASGSMLIGIGFVVVAAFLAVNIAESSNASK